MNDLFIYLYSIYELNIIKMIIAEQKPKLVSFARSYKQTDRSQFKLIKKRTDILLLDIISTPVMRVEFILQCLFQERN